MKTVGFGVILRLAVGFGFLATSNSLENRGDLAAALGTRSEALGFHVTALMLVIAALACFLSALWAIFRGNKEPGSPAGKPPRQPPLSDEVAAEASFDADAALARYLNNKAAATEPPPVAPAPPPPRSGFGRKPG